MHRSDPVSHTMILYTADLRAYQMFGFGPGEMTFPQSLPGAENSLSPFKSSNETGALIRESTSLDSRS